MIYRKETPFKVTIGLNDEYPYGYLMEFWVTGSYYYAPNESYGEYPMMFTQNDSRIIIWDIENIDCEPFSCMDLLNDIDFLDQVEELVWEQLLSKDE